MFARLSRLLRAWMGFFISAAEDPEVMLQDAIEEMRMTMPKLNSVLVATRATVIRLEEERDALLRHERTLTGSIQAALRDGSAAARSVAEEEALQLQQLRIDLTSTQEQLAAAAAHTAWTEQAMAELRAGAEAEAAQLTKRAHAEAEAHLADVRSQAANLLAATQAKAEASAAVAQAQTVLAPPQVSALQQIQQQQQAQQQLRQLVNETLSSHQPKPPGTSPAGTTGTNGGSPGTMKRRLPGG